MSIKCSLCECVYTLRFLHGIVLMYLCDPMYTCLQYKSGHNLQKKGLDYDLYNRVQTENWHMTACAPTKLALLTKPQD